LSEKLRYLLTLDAKTGEMLKAEQLGEAGDLAEVDLAGFARSLAGSLRVHGGMGGAGAPSPVIINIYSGGAQDDSAKVTTPQDPTGFSGWTTPPPTTPRPKPPKPSRPRKK